MILYHSLDELPDDFAAAAVTIGNFDGVHRGHARIIEQLAVRSRQFAGPAVVFTFEPHPVRLLRPEVAPPPLTWVDRKAELLSALEVDVMVAYPTSPQLLSLSPEEYHQQIICDRLRARAVVEGPNFFFGKNRAGDVTRLAALCRDQGQILDVVEPLRLRDEFISSSRVRQAIQAGDLQAANLMLTQPYRIRGMVTHGAGRGSTIGFPTANVSAIDTLLPGLGVYAGASMIEGERWPAAINVGPNPTFGEQTVKVEVHLIGFSGSLYGCPLEVDFLSRLRDIRPFESPSHLITQLHQDVIDSQQVFRQQIQSPE